MPHLVHRRPGLRTTTLGLGIGLSVALAGCPMEPTEPASDGGTNEEGPAYVIAQEIYAGDSSEMLISVVASPDALDIDASDGLAVSGSARGVFSELGYVFVPDNEAFTFTRYAVDDALQLVEPLTVSFADLGLTLINDTYVLAPDRAYTTTADGLLLVWNPSTMERLESVDLEVPMQAGLVGTPWLTGRDVTLGVREYAALSGYLNLPIAWQDWANVDGAPVTGLLSVAADDASDQQLSTSSCGALGQWAVTGRDGRMYTVATPAWGPFYQHSSTDFAASAFARVDDSGRGYDEGYCEQVAPMAGGDEAGLLAPFGEGRFLLRTLSDEALQSSTPDGYWADIAYACSFWEGEIDEAGELTLTEAPAMGIDGGCYGGLFGLDGNAYFNIPGEGYTTSTIAKWTGTSLEEVATTTGYVWTFERVR